MRKRKGFILFLLALIVGVGITWFNELWLDHQEIHAKTKEENRISSYFTGFSLIATDPQGNREYSLSGKHLSHRSGADKSEILSPHMVSFRSDGSQDTEINAEEGFIAHDSDIVTLVGSVNLISANNDETTKLDTETLTYHSRDQYVETDADVKITSGSSVLTGKGMDSRLKDNILRIHSNVHSTFKTQ